MNKLFEKIENVSLLPNSHRRNSKCLSESSDPKTSRQSPSFSGSVEVKNAESRSSSRANSSSNVECRKEDKTIESKQFDVMAALKVTQTPETSHGVKEEEHVEKNIAELPNSDAEFAALLGISLEQLNPVSQVENQPSFSRLSQFFSNPIQNEKPSSIQPGNA